MEEEPSLISTLLIPNILPLIGIPVVFLLGLVGSLTPPLTSKSNKNFDVTDTQIFRLLSGFAAGVIVAVALVHSFPEGQESLEENLEYDYPFAGFFAVLGVFATFTVESIVSHFLRRLNKRKSKKINLEIEKSLELSNEVTESDDVDNDDRKLKDVSIEDKEENIEMEEKDNKSNSKVEIEMEEVKDMDQIKKEKLEQAKVLEELRNIRTKFYTEMYVLLFGLSFHSIFVGFTLGLSKNDVGLFIAILCHQLFEGFALGVRIARANFKKNRFIFLIDIVFASATPLGITIGLLVKKLVSKDPQTFGIIQGTFNSFSAGILIFVGLVHMLAEEVEREEIAESLPKYLVIYFGALAGAAFMSLLAIWA